MGKGSKRRSMQVSQDEYVLRWAYGRGELGITEEEFKKRLKIIREKTGKP